MMAKFMDLPKDYIRLPEVCRTLRLDYNPVHRAVVAGQIPVEKRGNGNGFYVVLKSDLPSIARLFGARYDAGQIAA